LNQHGYGSPVTVGATNPDEVRQHIANDLGYEQTNQSYMRPNQMTSGGYGSSSFAQFGTDPQVVRQHIQQDLGNRSPQSYGYGSHQQNVGSAYGQTSGYGQSTFSQFGTNPQVVQQHIQQDLNGYGGGYTQSANTQGYPQRAQQMQPQPQPQPQQSQQSAGYNSGAFQQIMTGSPNHQQMVQGQIRQDLSPYTDSYSNNNSNTNPSYGNQMQTSNSGGMMSQYGTNPQVVQSHIQQDLGHNSGYSQNAGYQQMGGMITTGATNPQVVRQHIAQDLNYDQMY